MGQQISLPVLKDVTDDGVAQFDTDMHDHQLKENGFSQIKVLPWGFTFHLSGIRDGQYRVVSMPVMALRYDAEAYVAMIFFIALEDVIVKLKAHGGVEFNP